MNLDYKDEQIQADYLRAIQAAFVSLLEGKHLYQSVNVDLSQIRERLKLRRPRGNSGGGAGGRSGRQLTSETSAVAREKAIERAVDVEVAKLGAMPWLLFSGFRQYQKHQNIQNLQKGIAPGFPAERLPLILPPVRVPCTFCDCNRWPHNPGGHGIDQDEPCIASFEVGAFGNEVVYLIGYMCQNCPKRQPVYYLIRRRGLKLTIAGRSEIEVIDVPSCLPKEEAPFFRDAVIFFNAGKTLAALFYLRTFLEQYLRRVTQITTTDGRRTGDQLADAYRGLLHPEFPTSLNSVRKLYNELSAKIHEAGGEGEEFKKAREELVRHFEQLQILPLKAIPIVVAEDSAASAVTGG